MLLPGMAGRPAPQEAPPEPPARLPAAAGVYYRPASGEWKKLEIVPVENSKIRGEEVFVQTDGMTRLDMVFAYPGAMAGLRISEPRPIFYVRGIGSPKQALIVQLSRKKDRRTAETSSSAAAAGNMSGFKLESIRRTDAVPLAGGVFSVMPEERLKPGEYILLFGQATSAYDFGVDAK